MMQLPGLGPTRTMSTSPLFASAKFSRTSPRGLYGDVVEELDWSVGQVLDALRKQGLDKTHPLNHGGGCRFDFGRVKFVNAIHSSSLPNGTYGGNPGGFVVETAEGNFYFSGDTALTMDMKLIGESTRLKFAALCVGDTFTMGVDDAIKAAEFIRCDEIVGIHFDTFPPIKIDHDAAAEKFKAAGKQLHLLDIGCSHVF